MDQAENNEIWRPEDYSKIKSIKIDELQTFCNMYADLATKKRLEEPPFIYAAKISNNLKTIREEFNFVDNSTHNSDRSDNYIGKRKTALSWLIDVNASIPDNKYMHNLWEVTRWFLDGACEFNVKVKPFVDNTKHYLAVAQAVLNIYQYIRNCYLRQAYGYYPGLTIDTDMF